MLQGILELVSFPARWPQSSVCLMQSSFSRVLFISEFPSRVRPGVPPSYESAFPTNLPTSFPANVFCRAALEPGGQTASTSKA